MSPWLERANAMDPSGRPPGECDTGWKRQRGTASPHLRRQLDPHVQVDAREDPAHSFLLYENAQPVT
jgi:hypothetical protein